MALLPDELDFSSRLRLVEWVEAASSERHDARSLYVERFWLPILGPSTTLLLRYFACRLGASPGGVELDVAETARSLGLGERAGRRAPFLRTLQRAADFSMVTFRSDGELAAKTKLPTLADRQLARLPVSLRIAHVALLSPTRRAAAPPLPSF